MKSKKTSKFYFKSYRVEVKFGNVEKALRQLDKTLEDSGFYDELKKRRYFEKPSEKKRRKKRLSRYM